MGRMALQIKKVNNSILDDADGVAINGESLAVIDHAHREVHESEFFTVSYRNNALGSNAIAAIHLLSGLKTLHFGWAVYPGGLGEFDFILGGTFTSDGTALSVRSNNLASPGTPLTTAWKDPTFNVAGTSYFESTVSGSFGGTRAGSPVRAESEWIIPASTHATIQVKNTSGGAASFSLVAAFYEE